MSDSREPSAQRFSTGDEYLDRSLGGGVPAGELLALTAPPGTQSQLLLRQLAASRTAVYVATGGTPEPKVREHFLDDDSTTVACLTPCELLDSPRQLAEAIPPEAFAIVDAVDPIERAADPPAYRALLTAFEKRLRAVDAVGVLHCQAGSSAALRGDTLHRADHVWQLRAEYTSRQIGYPLLVTKARGHAAAEEPVPLLLTDEVNIDTSWSI